MKYCPICDERYDEEILRFCTKDGTPLVNEEQPNFTALPSKISDNADDFGDETVIRRKVEPSPPAPSTSNLNDPDRSERIVIPTTYPATPPPVRTRTAQAYYPPPQQSTTAKTVALTVLGTLAVVGLGVMLFWMMQGDSASNVNVNVNANFLDQNANLNTNLGFDSNFNFNANSNFNASPGLIDSNINTNFNSNTNLRTPAPSPSPRISPTQSPSPSANPSPSPERTPTPASSPVPVPTSKPPANIPPPPTPREGTRPPALNSNRPADDNR